MDPLTIRGMVWPKPAPVTVIGVACREGAPNERQPIASASTVAVWLWKSFMVLSQPEYREATAGCDYPSLGGHEGMLRRGGFLCTGTMFPALSTLPALTYSWFVPVAADPVHSQ